MRLALGLNLVATLILSACAATAPPAPTVTISCPPLKAYTTAQEQAAASALAALDANNPLVSFMADYGALRAADRACLGK